VVERAADRNSIRKDSETQVAVRTHCDRNIRNSSSVRFRRFAAFRQRPLRLMHGLALTLCLSRTAKLAGRRGRDESRIRIVRYSNDLPFSTGLPALRDLRGGSVCPSQVRGKSADTTKVTKNTKKKPETTVNYGHTIHRIQPGIGVFEKTRDERKSLRPKSQGSLQTSCAWASLLTNRPAKSVGIPITIRCKSA